MKSTGELYIYIIQWNLQVNFLNMYILWTFTIETHTHTSRHLKLCSTHTSRHLKLCSTHTSRHLKLYSLWASLSITLFLLNFVAKTLLKNNLQSNILSRIDESSFYKGWQLDIQTFISCRDWPIAIHWEMIHFIIIQSL